jgi:hypothetical protein
MCFPQKKSYLVLYIYIYIYIYIYVKFVKKDTQMNREENIYQTYARTLTLK